MEENQLKKKYEGLENKFRVMVQVDRAKLSEEMAQNSARMFSINVAKADAEYLKDRAEHRIKVLEAKLDKLIRRSALKRKPSEQQIKQRISRSPEIIVAHEKYFEAKYRYNVCWAAANAIHQKGDQMTNLGHILRKEMETGTKARVINSEVARLNKKKGRV